MKQQHVTAFDGRRPRLVGPPDTEESRVVRIDQVGQRRLADPRGQRKRGDRHPRADPERRVAGEQQVGQRLDDEVAAMVDATDKRHLAACDRQLGERHTRHQDVRSPAGSNVRRYAKGAAPAAVRAVASRRGRDAVHPRRAAGQRLGQQFRQQQHLDAARAQHLGERVVLRLRLGHPWQPVEQQRVVFAA